MPLLVIGTEKDFAALRPRLFEGRVSAKVAEEVTSAVRAANPHVDLNRLTPGTVLTIPDAPQVRMRRDLSLDETAQLSIGVLAQGGRVVLEELEDTAKAREREEAAERTSARKALASRDLQGLMRKVPELKTDVKVALGAIQEEESRAKDDAAALKQALADWKEDIDLLEARLQTLT